MGTKSRRPNKHQWPASKRGPSIAESNSHKTQLTKEKKKQLLLLRNYVQSALSYTKRRPSLSSIRQSKEPPQRINHPYINRNSLILLLKREPGGRGNHNVKLNDRCRKSKNKLRVGYAQNEKREQCARTITTARFSRFPPGSSSSLPSFHQ